MAISRWGRERTKFAISLTTRNSSPENIHNLLADELNMTMSALKSHPKVYWIWNHRRWCLENIPNGPGKEGDVDFLGWKQSAWNKELFVVEKMLDADARNCKFLSMYKCEHYIEILHISLSLELQAICTCEYAHSQPRIRWIGVYFSQDRGQLFQFLRLASAIQDSHLLMGTREGGRSKI